MLVELFVLIAYSSLAIELIFFPVPSMCSCYRILSSKDSNENQSDHMISNALYLRTYQESLIRKLFIYLLPTAIGIFTFLLPLITIFLPQTQNYWIPFHFAYAGQMHVAGCMLLVFGRLATFGSALYLRNSISKPFQFTITSELAQGSFFKFSRNPGLVGMYVFYAGLLLIFPNWVMVVGFVIYITNMHRRVLIEESYLADNYGQTFMQYVRNTRRYL